jgi:hypothetical protein
LRGGDEGQARVRAEGLGYRPRGVEEG